MAYQPVPAPSAPRRTTRTILIVVGVVLVLCCLGGSIGGFWLYRTVKDAVGPASDSATTYLDAMRRGDHSAAYGQLCAPTRSRISEADFTRMQAAQPRLREYEITGVNVTSTNGRTEGSATVRLTQENGTETTQLFRLVKEDGTWRVCQ
ncbi:hypothetical protein CA850_07895 [Micromonospora echinospora]|uniref:Uncharacterized protein n=1 Tax=Micromonospora echinospora TaxID=1877 RepID=A0A1C4X7D0_MICEC|nr:DUF4878 domain-containing protein [Micromonospora echinospora]OZV82220.1 hypothetical protein CA850_07895 [Micromonospora echinospora]SCF04287.1 protein of unknown function [Micromonospora echinospora]